MAGSPVTRQEALQYDAAALRADTDKRKSNIKIFEETIDAEQKAIDQNNYIISQIDPNHADVEILEQNTKKRKINIKTFKDAINEENNQIERDLKMIKIIIQGERGKGKGAS